MNTLQKIVIVSLCVSIALAPALVEARAGGRSGGSGSSHQSMGSRGSKTHDSNGNKPIERSMTPKPAPAPAHTPQATPVPPPPRMVPPMAQPSFFQRHPFLSGVAGGLVGSWIGSMLFNHSRGEANNDWNDAAAASPTAKAFGSILPFLFIAGLIMAGIWFYRRKTAFASNMTGYSSDPMPIRGENWGSSTTTATFSLPIVQSDVSAFSNLLVNIQDAWSKSDLAKMKRLVTPEMLSYFSEALSDNASLGVENRVEQISILKQEIKDGWEEGDKHYATILFVWNALDYSVNLNRKPGDPDYVSDGDLRQPVEASEAWTFVRSHGGDWLLSAIQQV